MKAAAPEWFAVLWQAACSLLTRSGIGQYASFAPAARRQVALLIFGLSKAQRHISKSFVRRYAVTASCVSGTIGIGALTIVGIAAGSLFLHGNTSFHNYTTR